MIAFDPTINAGHLLTFAIFVIGGLAAFYALRGEVRVLSRGQDDMSKRMDGFDEGMKKLTDVLVTVAVQSERMAAFDRRMDDLQHGRGFVLELPHAIRAGSTK